MSGGWRSIAKSCGRGPSHTWMWMERHQTPLKRALQCLIKTPTTQLGAELMAVVHLLGAIHLDLGVGIVCQTT